MGNQKFGIFLCINCEPCVKVSVKQFMVANCSKEQPGPIVTESLRYGVFIPIVTSKELYFYDDFKYISFIKFSLTHHKLCA